MRHPVLLLLFLCLLLLVLLGKPQSHPVLSAGEASPSATGGQPLLRLNGVRFWPGAMKHPAHPELADYYPMPFAQNSLVTKRPVSAAIAGDLIHDGFPAIAASTEELAKIVMTKLGTLVDKTDDPSAVGLISTYKDRLRLIDSRGISLNPDIVPGLVNTVKDPTTYKILTQFFFKDSGFFDASANYLTNRYTFVSSGQLAVAKILSNVGPYHIGHEALWFHELLHYFFDKIDSDASKSQINIEQTSPYKDEHEAVYALTQRFELNNSVAQESLDKRSILLLQLFFAPNIGFLTGPGEALGRKITTGFERLRAFQDLPPEMRIQKKNIADFLGYRSAMSAYMNDPSATGFYRDFVDRTMKSIVERAPDFSAHTDGYYQDLAYLWAYYAVLYREMFNLSVALQDSRCARLPSTGGQPYLERVYQTTVFKKYWVLFSRQLAEQMYIDAGASLDVTSHTIMLGLIKQAASECTGCAVPK